MVKHTTLNQYLATRQLQAPALAPALRELIEAVAHACKIISHTINQGVLGGVLGSLGSKNVQGEVQKKLDVLSNDILLESTEWGGHLAAMASEELQTLHRIPRGYPKGDYLLLFDPLDGSSNIDVNVSIGTIFSILHAPSDSPDREVTEEDFLQAGHQQVAAGYAIYGPQTLFVLTVGQGVVGFTLDRAIGTWVLTHKAMRIPTMTQEFAINMSNQRYWAPSIQHYIRDCLAGQDGPRGKNFNMRWLGSMVADVHRILTRGGIFLYPWDTREPKKPGKLRLMYEANPMSLLVEQAGGRATTGTQRILEVPPTRLHQRVSVILGSRHEVATVAQYYQKFPYDKIPGH